METMGSVSKKGKLQEAFKDGATQVSEPDCQRTNVVQRHASTSAWSGNSSFETSCYYVKASAVATLAIPRVTKKL